MSSSFCTAFFKDFKVVKVRDLKGCVVSLDVLPFLYRSLYNTIKDKDKAILKSDKKVITSYIAGFLNLVSWFKRNDIDVIICIDGVKHTPVKNETIRKRIQQRKRSLEKLEQKRSLYTEEEYQILVEKTKAYIGTEQKKKIVALCEALGLRYYFQDYVEGEKACMQLKKQGVSDCAISPDGDSYLFGVDFYNHVDVFKNELIYRDYTQNLQKVSPCLSPQNLVLCIVATGCDYTSGVKGLGPRRTLDLLHKDEEELRKRAFMQIPNYDEICRYISEEICLEKCRSPSKDPLLLEKLLTEWSFSSTTIGKYLKLFFKEASPTLPKV